jgi:hypothetical protein
MQLLRRSIQNRNLTVNRWLDFLCVNALGARVFAAKRPASVRYLTNSCLLLLPIFAGLASCAESVKHDETLAARRAIEFAQAAFIDQNSEKAYELLSDGGKRHLSFDKFKETVTRMHPRGFPTKVTAKEFQPMPGENAIWIYLTGRNAEDQFGYRFTLERNSKGDYRVLTFDSGVVGRMFSPLSEKQPFKTNLSTR